MATVSLHSATAPLSWVPSHGMAWVRNHRSISISSLAALTILIAGRVIYRRLNDQNRLPFDSWRVTLGLARRDQFTREEATQITSGNLEEVLSKYSPTDLIPRLYAYTISTQEIPAGPQNPVSSASWHLWILANLNNSKELINQASQILSSFTEYTSLSLEDEREQAIKSRIAPLQIWAPLFQSVKGTWNEKISQFLLSPPTLFVSLFFYYTAQTTIYNLWEISKEWFPKMVESAEEKYKLYKPYLSLLLLTASAVLYKLMKHRKGYLKNLTENWKNFHGAHRALDLIPSFKEGIHKLLIAINGKNDLPHNNGFHIIWNHLSNGHRTFNGELGNMLGELTATGRVFNDERTAEKFPHLKDLNILELDLRNFQSLNQDTLDLAWSETTQEILKEGNAIVVLQGLSAIASCLNPQTHKDEPQKNTSPNELEAKLFHLLARSLRGKEFRCIIEADEEDKKLLITNPSLSNLFQVIDAPPISSSDVEPLVQRLCSSNGTYQSLPETHIHDLLFTLQDTFEAGVIDIGQILNFFQKLTRDRHDLCQQSPPDNAQQVWQEKLQEAQKIKDTLLQKTWEIRRTGKPIPPALAIPLLLFENILIASYKRKIVRVPTNPSRLSLDLKRYFYRFFSHAEADEVSRLRDIPANLKKNIEGQDLALQEIGQRVLGWRRTFTGDDKPLVFILAGPSGTGKSQTARFLAYELLRAYGITDASSESQLEKSILKIGLNEQQADFEWRLIKAEIEDHLLQWPMGIVIFEEFDKMPDQAKNNLLRFLDDSKTPFKRPFYVGKQHSPLVDKCCTVFLLTCNTASDLLSTPPDVNNLAKQYEEDKAAVRKALADSYPDKKSGNALNSRLDDVFPYRPVTNKEQISLIDKRLNLYVTRKIVTQQDSVEIRKIILNINPLPLDVRALKLLVRETTAKYMESKSPLLKQ